MFPKETGDLLGHLVIDQQFQQQNTQEDLGCFEPKGFDHSEGFDGLAQHFAESGTLSLDNILGTGGHDLHHQEHGEMDAPPDRKSWAMGNRGPGDFGDEATPSGRPQVTSGESKGTSICDLSPNAKDGIVGFNAAVPGGVAGLEVGTAIGGPVGALGGIVVGGAVGAYGGYLTKEALDRCPKTEPQKPEDKAPKEPAKEDKAPKEPEKPKGDAPSDSGDKKPVDPKTQRGSDGHDCGGSRHPVPSAGKAIRPGQLKKTTPLGHGHDHDHDRPSCGTGIKQKTPARVFAHTPKKDADSRCGSSGKETPRMDMRPAWDSSVGDSRCGTNSTPTEKLKLTEAPRKPIIDAAAAVKTVTEPVLIAHQAVAVTAPPVSRPSVLSFHTAARVSDHSSSYGGGPEASRMPDFNFRDEAQRDYSWMARPSNNFGGGY